MLGNSNEYAVCQGKARNDDQIAEVIFDFPSLVWIGCCRGDRYASASPLGNGSSNNNRSHVMIVRQSQYGRFEPASSGKPLIGVVVTSL